MKWWIIPLILIFILCIVIGGLILYIKKYILIIAYRDFMKVLKEKLENQYENNDYYNYYNEFESVFGTYNNDLFFLGPEAHRIFTFIEIILIGVAIIFQLCNNCWKIFRAVISLLILSGCLFINIYNIYISFQIKNKVNLTDDQIYIFDDDFNNEIKENLKKMYNRKIYIITSLFFVIVGLFTQFVLTIIDLRISPTNNNNVKKNNNKVSQIIVNETGKENDNSNVNIIMKKDNINLERPPKNN